MFAACLDRVKLEAQSEFICIEDTLQLQERLILRVGMIYHLKCYLRVITNVKSKNSNESLCN